MQLNALLFEFLLVFDFETASRGFTPSYVLCIVWSILAHLLSYARARAADRDSTRYFAPLDELVLKVIQHAAIVLRFNTTVCNPHLQKKSGL